MGPRKNKLFLFGAPKCGTTSVANWLNLHPAFKLGWAKEPCFFTDYRSTTFNGPGTPGFPRKTVYEPDAYEAMFDDADASWGIDGSTDYFARSEAPGMIRDYVADTGVEIRLVCILRDPVLRAFSQYAHCRDRRFETESFPRALDLEETRRDEGWIPLFYHVERSRYATHLKRYFETFGQENVLILPFEAVKDGDTALRAIEGFVGVEPFSYPDALPVRNASAAAERSRTLDRLIRGDSPLKALAKAVLPKGLRERVKAANATHLTPKEADLRAAYDRLRDEIDACADLVPFDTRHWTRF